MSLSTTPDRPHYGRLALEVLLVAALALFVMLLARALQPLGMIGMANDDGLYALYAKALVTGQGYIDLSAIHPRPAMRYPIGMPGLLALVATGASGVAEMVRRFEWVPIAFTGLYVATVYGYFTRFARLTALAAAGLTLALSLGHSVLYAGATVMSDMPCAVLTLWGLMAMERMWRRPWAGTSSWAGWLGAGALVGMAALFRYSTASMIVAIAIAMLSYRQWKPLLGTYAGMAIVLAPWLAFRLIAGGESYASEYNERFPALGKLFYSFGHSAGSMIAEAIPSLMLPLDDVRSVATLLVGAVVSTLVLFGAVRWFRAPRPHETPLAPAYVLVTILMALVWQVSYLYLQVDLAGRLLVAAVPLMFLCLGRGVVEIAELVGRGGLPWRTVGTVACVLLALGRVIPLGLAQQRGHNPFVARPAPPAMMAMLDHLKQVTKPTDVVYAWNGPMVSFYAGCKSVPMTVMYGISTPEVVDALLYAHPTYVLGWPSIDANGKDETVGVINAFQNALPYVLITEWVSPDPRVALFRVDYAELDRLIARAKAHRRETP